MNKCHELKTDPYVFQAVVEGKKTCEIRYNDRNYQVGDALVLRETKHTGFEMQKGAALKYTGRTHVALISHILHGPIYGLEAGWVILSMNGESAIKELHGLLEHTKAARNQYYDDMCKYKDACTDLIKYRDTLYLSIKKRDAYITMLIRALLDHCVKDCGNDKKRFNCDHEECTTYRALLTGPTEAYEMALKQRKGAACNE